MIVLFFFVGLAIGSFLNSVIYRIEKRESIIKGRSYCPYCKRKLSWLELIPLVSFFLQSGKCRGCKKKISWQYPLVELATGLLFVLAMPNIFYLFAISCLIIIFVYDLKHYIIPNEVVYLGIIVAFLYQFQFPIFNYLLAGLIAGLFFLAIVLLSKGKWMGMGDVKLVLFMGLILGWPNILTALFVAFLIGALVSIILITFKKKTFKSEIPFGPFLAGATVVTIFWGNILLDWYLNLFI